MNEECLVSVCHQHALIASLPFVHMGPSRRTLSEGSATGIDAGAQIVRSLDTIEVPADGDT